MKPSSAPPRLVDCEAGRKLGCGTFCCRLIVELEPTDTVDARTPAGTLAKDPRDGWCVHLDRQTWRCTVWDRRPRICRRYDCNRDPLLQIVVRDSYRDLVAFSLREPPPETTQLVSVPYLDSDPEP